MKILAIYKSMEDVVIFEDDNGDKVIRAFRTDEGTEEERKIIQDRILSSGFQVNDTKKV